MLDLATLLATSLCLKPQQPASAVAAWPTHPSTGLPLSPVPLHNEPFILAEAAARAAAEGTTESCRHIRNIPSLLREAFARDDDMVRRTHYDPASSSRTVTNLTCLRPPEGVDGHMLFDHDLLQMPTAPGRECAGGCCASACSRVMLSGLVSDEESHRAVQLVTPWLPPPDDNTFNLYLKLSAASGDVATHLQLIRLVERMRRAIAIEYGLALSSLRPSQAFVSRITEETETSVYTQLHVDESSTKSFHYSAVLYLSPASDFEGGALWFGVPGAEGAVGTLERAAGESTLVTPHAGLCALFSSGWENPHAIAPLHAGSRLAMPAFFTTQPSTAPPPFAPGDEEAKAEALWRCGIMPERAEDFFAFMQAWPLFFD